MELKILAVILIYYSLISLTFLTIGDYLTGYSTNIDLNSSEMASGEIDTGGVFSTGLNFGRFIGLVGLGIGLPESTPAMVKVLFAIWETGFLIFTVGFVISSIWDG